MKEQELCLHDGNKLVKQLIEYWKKSAYPNKEGMTTTFTIKDLSLISTIFEEKNLEEGCMASKFKKLVLISHKSNHIITIEPIYEGGE